MRKELIVGAALALAASAEAQVEVILSEVGPTSSVGVAGRAISSMSSFDLSPNGLWWSLSLGLNGSGVDNNMDVRGQGGSFTDVIYQEGVTPLPAHPGVTGFFGFSSSTFQTSINDNGHVTGLAANTVSGEPNEFIYAFDGSAHSLVAAEGSAVPSIPGAFYGNTLHSPNMLANGQSAFVAENMTGVDASMDSATLSSNGNQFGGLQSGVTNFPVGTMETMDQSGFYVTPDGSTFLLRGDTNADISKDDVLIYGTVGTSGTAVLIEDTTPIAGGFYDDTFHAFLADNGDWYASGDLTTGEYVAIRNGSVLAMTGDAAPNGYNYGTIPNIAGDANGNYLWIWDTDNPDTTADEILVYNGTTLILSEGDMIMFDQGNGPEPAIIDEFNAFDVQLSVDGWAYLMVQLDNLNGTNIGDAFIRVRVPAPGSALLFAASG
ncbi:MAG: hypothetical protein KDA21_06540, partial [Phycisphaerales bacterium]|nr:hypothetical protein [Phycisphaerales bacterium]